MNADEPSQTSTTAAAARLALTRLHLQQALSPREMEQPGATLGLPSAAGAGRHAAATPSARTPSAPTPAAQLLLATMRAWWARHPLHAAGRLALQTADAAARPMAHKHPLTLLLVAAACGAALAWARPWRQLNARVVMAVLVPGVLPGLVPGLLSSLLPLLTPKNAASPLWARLLGALLPSAAPTPRPVAPQSSRVHAGTK